MNRTNPESSEIVTSSVRAWFLAVAALFLLSGAAGIVTAIISDAPKDPLMLIAYFIAGLLQLVMALRFRQIIGSSQLVAIGLVYILIAVLYWHMGDVKYVTMIRLFHITFVLSFFTIVFAIRFHLAVIYRDYGSKIWAGILVTALITLANGVILVFWILDLGISRLVVSFELLANGLMLMLMSRQVILRKIASPSDPVT
jgi:hypothetical protein